MPDFSPGFADADATAKGEVIVSDAGTDTLNIYTMTGKLKAKITGFDYPAGLAPGPMGDVYVTNTGASTVLLYKNDYKTLLATLPDAGQYPVGVAYDFNTGVVAVTNMISTSGGAGSVSFYARGAKTPCTTVGDSAWARAYFGAFDDAGNLYVDGQNGSGATVVGVVKGACAAKTITTLTTANSIGFPGGVAVSPADTILIDDQTGAAIYTYNAPLNNMLGKPVATTPLAGSDPVTFALTARGTNVWTVDAGLADVLEYGYPAGGSPLRAITGLKNPVGVIVLPVEMP